MLKKHKNYMESWCFWSFLETAGKTLEQFLQMAGNAGSRNVLQTHQKPFQGHRKKTTKMKSILFYQVFGIRTFINTMLSYICGTLEVAKTHQMFNCLIKVINLLISQF